MELERKVYSRKQRNSTSMLVKGTVFHFPFCASSQCKFTSVIGELVVFSIGYVYLQVTYPSLIQYASVLNYFGRGCSIR